MLLDNRQERFDGLKCLLHVGGVPSSGSQLSRQQPPSFADVVLRQHKRDFIFFEQCRHLKAPLWRPTSRDALCPVVDHLHSIHSRALYQVVKVEAGPETKDHEITCRVCGGPLAGREGKLVLKYFLLRKGIPSRRRA